MLNKNFDTSKKHRSVSSLAKADRNTKTRLVQAHNAYDSKAFEIKSKTGMIMAENRKTLMPQ